MLVITIYKSPTFCNLVVISFLASLSLKYLITGLPNFGFKFLTSIVLFINVSNFLLLLLTSTVIFVVSLVILSFNSVFCVVLLSQATTDNGIGVYIVKIDNNFTKFFIFYLA
ncbi:MAG: hypothetical protein H9Q65_03635 [Spiroplasma ixodetis]|nr:hypothetical protein [Spiroplasma ixodetis]MBP1528328.1 hypothetical protein [Spiroplasma ixodetis]